MRKVTFAVLIMALAGVFFMTGCGDDLPPDTALVKGTVTIENTDVWEIWQDSGEVQLTIFPEFSLNPPAGWGEIPDGTFGPGVPGGTFAIGAPFNAQNPVVFEYEAGKTDYDFEIEVDPGTYSALALGFRHDFVQDPTLKSATIGVHHNDPDVVSHGVVVKADVGGGNIVTFFNFPPPSTFTVADGDVLEINFKADFGFVEQWYR